MFLAFLYPLVDIFPFFRVFRYITFRAAYAAVTALLFSFLLGPVLIRMLKQRSAGEKIRKDAPQRHLVKQGIPTMGGILIVSSIMIASLLWMDLQRVETWIVLVSMVGFGTIGFIDDYLKTYRAPSQGLSTTVKLGWQVILACAIAFVLYLLRNDSTTLLFVPFYKHPLVDLQVLYIPFAILLLVSSTNAVNLTDGLDGLATGLVVMVAITFTVLSYVSGRVDYSEYLDIAYINSGGELAILSFGLVGACVGFLWFNAHPAEIIMGDTGSLALGGLLGVVALLIKKEMLLIISGGVFVLEALSVIIQVAYYKLKGRRVFLMAPIHHHFELRGWSESKVVFRLWILGGLCAILSLSTLKIQ